MTDTNVLVDVAPAIPLPSSGRQAYTYSWPKGSPKIQTPRLFGRVTIPFGRLTVPGVVVKIHTARQLSPGTKGVAAISPVALTSKQVTFARWIAGVSHGGIGYTLRLFQPARPSKVASLSYPPTSRQSRKKVPAPRALIERSTPARYDRIARYVQRATRSGNQALVLVPERWMVTPLSSVIKTYMPTATALHAGMGAARLDSVWQHVMTGETKVVVGTQKALFLPYQNLSTVVVEEEYFPTHKLWDQYPRLHNVHAAEQLAGIHQAEVLYAGSLPSVRLHHAMKNGQVEAMRDNPLAVHLTALPFSPTDRAQRYPVPHELLIKVKAWQRQRQKTLIFYNRRDQVFIKKILLQHGIALHADTLALATSAIFTAAAGQTFDRIIWLFPERDFLYPDYRSTEHAFYTAARLQQLQSNARRKIIVVTRREDLVTAFIAPKLSDVYARLLRERERFLYPPFADLVRLTVHGPSEKAAWKKGQSMRQELDEQVAKLPPTHRRSLRIRGPFHSLEKTTGRFQVHLLLSGNSERLTSLYSDLKVDGADLAPARVV